jgi:predicted amidohydrolase
MSEFGVAGIQMAVSAFEENVTRMDRYVGHVQQRFPWVRMVLFSELAAFGPNPAKAQPLPGEAEAHLCDIARRHGVWLIPGSLFELRQTAAGNAIFNTTPIIDPHGHVIDRFSKLFPFRPFEQGVSAGNRFVVFDVPQVGRFGVSICYDMWFPETTRQLMAMGAEVILHPTMTDTIDREVELAIARASAVTNQVYFFDINGAADGGVGRSIVVDPSGYVLHEAGHGAEIIPIRIDLTRLRRERETGVRGLGQPLKSFRERECEFDVYRDRRHPGPTLAALGPLRKPGQVQPAQPVAPAQQAPLPQPAHAVHDGSYGAAHKQ